jgi:hypothetical protein
VHVHYDWISAAILMIVHAFGTLLKKLTVKLTLHLIKHHTMNMYGGGKVWIDTFFISALGVAEWSSPNPSCFPQGKKRPVPIG